MSDDALMGQQFRVDVADGRCIYEVTEAVPFEGTVVVEAVRQDSAGNPDDYRDPLLGERCVVSRSNVERLIERDGNRNCTCSAYRVPHTHAALRF